MSTNPEFVKEGIDRQSERLISLPWDIVSGFLVGGLGGSILVVLNSPLPALPVIVGGSIVMGSLGAVHWLQRIRSEEPVSAAVREDPHSHLASERRKELAKNSPPTGNRFDRDATRSVAFKILNKSRG